MFDRRPAPFLDLRPGDLAPLTETEVDRLDEAVDCTKNRARCSGYEEGQCENHVGCSTSTGR